MWLLQWIPVSYQPIAVFLVQIGLLSFAYWIVSLVVFSPLDSLGAKFRIPIGTILRITLGHYLLVSIAILFVTKATPQLGLTAAVIGGAVLWITMVSDLYEDTVSVVLRTLTSKLLFIVRFALIVGWFTLYILSLQGSATILLDVTDDLADLLLQALTLPYSIGIVIGMLCAYSLFRSLWKAVFATFGLLGLLKDLFAPGPVLSRTSLT